MTRKALELLAVLILSKFAIFTCFALGAGATNATLHASSGSDAVQSAIIGLGVMIAAAFSPMLLMSIIPGIAGSFGAGMPGGTAGAGALGVQTPSQIMRSTLSRVHTVRGGSSSHSPATARAITPRPPTPPGGSGGAASGSAARSGAAVEQAHSATNAHPAAAATAAGASVLATGAQAAASSVRRTASQSSDATQQAAHGSARDSDGPHVVSARGGASSPDGPHAASTTREPAASAAPHDAVRAQTQQLSLPEESGSSPDGFSQVRTRQPFTLETT
jgi:type IV secretion system protein TrbL